MCHNDDEDGFGACVKKAPPLPKSRPKGPAFDPVDKKDLDMQRMMKNMKDMGMGGMSMYNRDDMEDMMDDEDMEDPSLTDNPYKNYDQSIHDPPEPPRRAWRKRSPTPSEARVRRSGAGSKRR